jgi:hypothetical protein
MEKQESRREGVLVIPWLIVTLILMLKVGDYITVAMHRTCPCSTINESPSSDMPWPFNALFLLAKTMLAVVFWWVSQAFLRVLKKTVVRWIRRPPKET